jgi:hypothetical protein
MFPRRSGAAASAAALLLASTGAKAGDLRDFFNDLVVTQEDVLYGGTMTGPGVSEQAIFFGDFDPGDALDNLSNAAFSQFQNFPVGSTVAGFTYEFDPALAIFVRSTQGLGPLVAERAQTNGKGKLNVSFAYSHIDFNVFEGDDLDDIGVTLNGTSPALLAEGNQILGGPDLAQSPPSPNSIFLVVTEDVNLGPGQSIDFTLSGGGGGGDVVDVIAADGGAPDGEYLLTPDFADVNLDGDIKLDLFSILASFGVTDSIDIGLVIPVLRVELEGTVTTTGLFDQTAFLNTNTLVPLAPFSTGKQDDSKTGLGDIVLRGKARFFESDYGDVAARLDVSLPTGNEDDLMGRGNTGVLQQVIVSETFFGRVSPHVNAGFFFDTGDADQNQFRYVVGSDLMLHERVTVAADIVGSHDLKSDDIGDDQVGVSAGMKVNPWSRLVISGGALVRLNSEGLRADLIPSGAIEYTFF